jgi:hypothetical protein
MAISRVLSRVLVLLMPWSQTYTSDILNQSILPNRTQVVVCALGAWRLDIGIRQKSWRTGMDVS